ncbi:MAG: hypothetical protein RR565_11180 [Erysipelothrix sp.]
MIEKIFDANYFDNLDKFIGNDFTKRILGSKIVFYNNIEIEYVVDLVEGYINFYKLERGIKTAEIISNSREISYSKGKIAINLKFAFDTKSVMPNASQLFDKTYDEAIAFINDYCSPKYFSTSENAVGKINFKRWNDESLDIYYLNHRLEKIYFCNRINSEIKYISLYSSIGYLAQSLQYILLYQDLFDVKLTQDEIDDLIIN